ncbi:EAL domain-containing protein [Methylomarinum vadi]|uniref:EAL domain-containing protein n=1 Tax=Methylomarinum vadi TaxID=438855 RepID=UPI00068F565D|nr:EAL domain-containing protein [Methylomarinum vadi]
MNDIKIEIKPSRLLFVDDEINVLKALRRLFCGDMFRVYLASSGEEGVNILETQPIDLIICDMRMPQMNGAEFLERVAERWPDTVRILLTGYADMEAIIAAVNKGKILSYCHKPWDGDELKALVAKGLAQKRLLEERAQLFAIIDRQNEWLKKLNHRLKTKFEHRTQQLHSSVNRLDKTHEALSIAQQMAHLGNWEWDLSGKKLKCSEEAARILGVDSVVSSWQYKQLIGLVHTEDREDFRSFIKSLFNKGGTHELIHRIVRPNGGQRILRHRAELINDSSGRPNKITAVVHDITERKQAEIRAARMGRIFEHSWNEIYIIDSENLRFVEVSAGACHNLRYSLEEIRELTLLDLMPEFTRQQLAALLGPLLRHEKTNISFESEFRRKDLSRYPVELRVHLCREEKVPVFLVISQDISERKRYIEELEHKALFDGLTGLPNRTLLQDRLEHALSIAKREASCLAVLIIDVIRLREINDLLGHHNGDLVLQEVSARTAKSIRESDTLARLGADEFVIVMPALVREQLAVVAKKIQRIFEPPFEIEGIPLELEAAIGISLFPDHGDTPSQLIQHADIAVNVAKHETIGFSIYNPENDPFSVRRLRLHGELRKAINEGKLVMYFQPKVKLASGNINAVEALARWLHPVEGMIPPADFIPMIEQTGLIRPFTHWVLEEVVRQSSEWKEQDIDVQIAVNISTRNLLDPDLVESIMSLLSAYRITADRIILEITESSIMSRPEQALKILTKLHGVGVKLSIDDFGTGYSSLAYLKQLPIAELKIDKTFVTDLAGNENDEVIVKSTIGLAHNLGLVVVAEGVEDKAALDRLIQLHCDMAQGYYLSRPLSAERMTAILLAQVTNRNIG